jgi:hypothetical protein
MNNRDSYHILCCRLPSVCFLCGMTDVRTIGIGIKIAWHILGCNLNTEFCRELLESFEYRITWIDECSTFILWISCYKHTTIFLCAEISSCIEEVLWLALSISEVPIWIFGPVTGYLDWILCRFLQSFQASAGIVSKIGFPLYPFLLILHRSYRRYICELLKASLNIPRTNKRNLNTGYIFRIYSDYYGTGVEDASMREVCVVMVCYTSKSWTCVRMKPHADMKTLILQCGLDPLK